MIVYSWSDDDGAWSSVDKQYTDPAPQSVAVQPYEQCAKISHSERVILAHTFLYDELPATDSLVPRTVPRLSALAQADYTIPVAPPAWFSFFWDNDQSLSENSVEIKKNQGGQFTPIYFGT